MTTIKSVGAYVGLIVPKGVMGFKTTTKEWAVDMWERVME
jgi:hypothetical protein